MKSSMNTASYTLFSLAPKAFAVACHAANVVSREYRLTQIISDIGAASKASQSLS